MRINNDTQTRALLETYLQQQYQVIIFSPDLIIKFICDLSFCLSMKNSFKNPIYWPNNCLKYLFSQSRNTISDQRIALWDSSFRQSCFLLSLLHKKGVYQQWPILLSSSQKLLTGSTQVVKVLVQEIFTSMTLIANRSTFFPLIKDFCSDFHFKFSNQKSHWHKSLLFPK